MHKELAVLLLCFGWVAHAASFNCAKATTPQEKAICLSPALSAEDDALTAAYAKLLHGVAPAVATELRGDQRDWLRGLWAFCGYAVSQKQKSWAACMQAPYEQRTRQLGDALFESNGIRFVRRTVTRYHLDSPEKTDPEVSARPDDWADRFATLSAQFPEALVDTPQWKAWNAAMELAVRRQQGTDGPQSGPAPAWKATDDVNADIVASVDLVSSHLVAGTVMSLWDGHGAHPSENSSQFNWLLTEERALKTEDIFRAGSGWAEFLYRRSDEDLHRKLDAMNGGDYTTFSPPGEMAKTVRAIVADPQSWQISKDGIGIVYQDYAVACYACRPEPTKIPWQSLQPYLNPAFEILR